MFTGLIETVGRLERYEPRSAGARLVIVREGAWDPVLLLGESISVQGACLTVTEAGDCWFACDVLAETLSRTNLAAYRKGQRLNLERALRLGDRLGGHLVSGHIDGVGRLAQIRKEGEDRVVRVACDRELADGVVFKGSVALDGISLTVTAVDAMSFEVKIIPWTWQHTSLHERSVHDPMHVEIDMIGKYVKHYLSQMTKAPLTEDVLRAAGYGV
jgi:riboflavin synthase